MPNKSDSEPLIKFILRIKNALIFLIFKVVLILK